MGREVVELNADGKKKRFKIIKSNNSRKLYIPFYLMLIILLGTIFYIRVNNKPLNYLALVMVIAFSVIIILGTEIHRLYNTYKITENSLIHIMGYFTKQSKRMDFNAISDFYIVQNLWQRIFSYGNIEVRLYSGDTTISVKNINNPSQFIDIIEQRIRSMGNQPYK